LPKEHTIEHAIEATCVEVLTHWSRDNDDLGEEVQARLRAEWGRLGGWKGGATYADHTGLDV
jgi:hypothetical protein